MTDDAMASSIAEVTRMFADSTDAPDSSRCLDSLISRWVTPAEAAVLVGKIGPYNQFQPDEVAAALGRLMDEDPSARVLVGRLDSPVLYVDADRALRHLFYDTSPQPAEVSLTDGSEWDREQHGRCNHATPPVDPAEQAEFDPAQEYIRVWWD